MKIKGSMERLINHMDVRRDLIASNSNYRPIMVVEQFIEHDIESLKVAVMTHAFDALNFYNGKVSQ